MSQASSSKTRLSTAPFAPGTSGKGSFRHDGETLAKRDYHLFHPRPDKTLYVALLFAPVPSFDALSLPATSALHFGATVLAMGPVTVTRNQLQAHFLSPAHLVFPTSGPPYHSTLPEILSVLTL